MKILFIVPYARHYDSRSVRELPTGGTERAATFLSEALGKLGHEARIVTTFPGCMELDTEWPDAVITQHAEHFLRFPEQTRKIWWCHQATDRPFICEGARIARRLADDVVTLSLFQQRDFARNLGIESTVIGYGVWLDEVQSAPKEPARLVYCSVPHRGLELAAELFPLIRQEEPDATFSVCSSLATWGKAEDDAQFQKLFDTLRETPGVILHGGLGQQGLWRELSMASVFFYPCIYEETYCMAMDEAMAHGCVPVVPAIGALPERWPPTCRLVHQAVQEIRTARQRPRRVARPLDWMMVAEKWESLLRG
jgi:glycosyltransferase involved in cell wall biosynthesis